MHCSLTFICVLSVFVLIYDNQKVVTAKTLQRNTRDTLQKYTTKYDNIDVDGVLHNKRLLSNYVNCLLDKGPCTPEGKELKTYLPDALATECSKCSDFQKKQGGQILAYILQYHRDYWNALIAKYDPQGNFVKKYGLDDNGDAEDYSDEE